MGLLRRFATIALAVALLVALTSLPALRFNRTSGSALAPSLAWAGGSPDETLKPPSQPPTQKSRAIDVRIERTSDPATSRGTRDAGAKRLSHIERWLLIYRVYLASVLRI
jgi:hypothetical protein